MKDTTLKKKVKELSALRATRDELDNKISELEEYIKAEMSERGEYEMRIGGYKLSWSEVTQSRFNQTEFKESYPNLYTQYLRESTYRRFLLNKEGK